MTKIIIIKSEWNRDRDRHGQINDGAQGHHSYHTTYPYHHRKSSVDEQANLHDDGVDDEEGGGDDGSHRPRVLLFLFSLLPLSSPLSSLGLETEHFQSMSTSTSISNLMSISIFQRTDDLLPTKPAVSYLCHSFLSDSVRIIYEKKL